MMSANGSGRATTKTTSAKRILAIDLDDSHAWDTKPFSAMFKEDLCQGGDEWSCLNLPAGDVLPDDALHAYDGIILSGGRFNIRDNCSWLPALVSLVQAASSHGEPKIFGVCLGHQVIAHALGGEVGFNSGKLFVCKAEKVACTAEFNRCLLPTHHDAVGVPCVVGGKEGRQTGASSAGVAELAMIVSHGDCVLALPPTATLLAASESCANEMFLDGCRGNIIGVQVRLVLWLASMGTRTCRRPARSKVFLCCQLGAHFRSVRAARSQELAGSSCWLLQAHPEFHGQMQFAMRDRIFPAVCKGGRLSLEQIAEAEASFGTFKPDTSQYFLTLISSWLHATRAPTN